MGSSLDGMNCSGGSAGNFGPFDYRSDKDKLPVVENRHFTPEIEQLQRGQTTANPMGDVQYTLVKFPNHHRALYSAVRYSLTATSSGERRKYPPAECFLQRAIAFSPDDSVPHMLYGLYLHRKGKLERSLDSYRVAEKLAPNDANLLYNLGLVLFDTGQYAESSRYAHRAYDYGITLPGLKRKLQQAGHWK
ncbi:MAG: tetratricopeptide repeat protein [Porticoccaceae bacterium]